MIINTSLALVAVQAMAAVQDPSMIVSKAQLTPKTPNAAIESRISELMQKRVLKDAVAQSYGALVQHYGETKDQALLDSHLGEFKSQVLLGWSTNDSTNLGGVDSGVNTSTTGASICHCHCHGSRGWR